MEAARKRADSMLYKIADLIVEVPDSGGMAHRCREYLTSQNNSADIIIRADRYNPQKYPTFNENDVAYMESGNQFSYALLNFNGFYLHSSAVEFEGGAYLFSGPCGMGKSTHTRLWQQSFGDAAQVFNDDKPALRCVDGVWYAYGTPWCGKDGINQNKRVRLAGICFLRRGEKNDIHRLDALRASTSIMSQTLYRFRDEQKLDLVLSHISDLVSKIPVFEFYNLPLPESAELSCRTMQAAAREAGIL